MGYGFVAHNNSYWPFAADDNNQAPLASDRYDNYPNDNATSNPDDEQANDDSLKNPDSPTTPSKPGMSVEESDPATSQLDSQVSIRASREGSSVVVRSQLEGFDRGTCEIKITNGTKAYSDSADIIYQPQGSLCAGFSIPIDKLGAGRWNVKLEASGAHASGSASTSIEVT